MSELFNDLLKFLSKIKVLIETIGLIGGIIIIFLTYQSVEMSRKNLEITARSLELLKIEVKATNEQLKLEKEKIKPSWKFIIQDDHTVKLSSARDEYRLNYFTFYFKTDTIKAIRDYPADYLFEIDSLKEIVIQQLHQQIAEDINYRQYEGRVPFGLEINYSYKGQQRVDYGIWLLMFKINWYQGTANELVIDVLSEKVEAYRYYSQTDSSSSFFPKLINDLNSY